MSLVYPEIIRRQYKEIQCEFSWRVEGNQSHDGEMSELVLFEEVRGRWPDDDGA